MKLPMPITFLLINRSHRNLPHTDERPIAPDVHAWLSIRLRALLSRRHVCCRISHCPIRTTHYSNRRLSWFTWPCVSGRGVVNGQTVECYCSSLASLSTPGLSLVCLHVLKVDIIHMSLTWALGTFTAFPTSSLVLMAYWVANMD